MSSVLVLSTLGIAVQAPRAGWLEYSDPGKRFSFYYPAEYGTPSQGTNSGYGDRVASIRFSLFSAGIQSETVVLGGEATVTKGFPYIDLQALGGLYDSIALEALPQALRTRIVAVLTPLSPSNFCEQLGKGQHVDSSDARLAFLTPQQQTAVVVLDKLGNANARILRCEVSGDVVVFHKELESEWDRLAIRRHVYGAVRFLKAPFSSFQIIRATSEAPSDDVMDTIAAVVKSFRKS